MTYDFHAAYDGVTGFNSPLPESQQSINNWINAGASADKIALGLAFYGHSFQLADQNNHGVGAPVSGNGMNDGFVNYVDVISIIKMRDGILKYFFSDLPFGLGWRMGWRQQLSIQI